MQHSSGEAARRRASAAARLEEEDMWMDSYVEVIRLRERIADAQRRAAMNHLLHARRPPRVRHGGRAFVARWLRRWAQPARREAMA